MKTFGENYRLILGEIGQALDGVDEAQVEAFIKALLEAEQVFFIGVGRVMLALEAMAKRFQQLGVKTHCVGDINEPPITDRDLLVIGSGSGESVVPVAIARLAAKYGARIAHLGSNPNSSLAPFTTIFVRIPVATKLNLPGEIPSKQLMTSLFDQSLYVFSDAVSLLIAERKGWAAKDLWRGHANLE
jgi:6-phospho-3-hexuloisomerase